MYIVSITATTSPQRLSSLITMPGGVRPLIRFAEIQMSPTASGTLYIGGSSAMTSNNAMEFSAGQTWFLDNVTNWLDLNNLWLMASTGTIRVNLALEVN